MHTVRCALAVALLAVAVNAGLAQEITGLTEYLEALDYPESLSLRLTGVFRSKDFETFSHRTLDPFEDPSIIADWALVKGERYDYELSLEAEEGWRLRSLGLSVMGQAAARCATGSATSDMALSGSFIARYNGFIFPHYAAEGEAERDCTARLATVIIPDPARFSKVETDDPGLKLARLDVWEFVGACERLGGEAVLRIDAPEGSTVELWTIGYPDEAVTLPVNEKVGTRTLPDAPWTLRIRLPEGMTVDDLPDGTVGLNLNAEGILPDWLGGGTNAAP